MSIESRAGESTRRAKPASIAGHGASLGWGYDGGVELSLAIAGAPLVATMIGSLGLRSPQPAHRT